MNNTAEHQGEEFEKDESIEKEGGLRLTVKGKCNNQKEPWVGLSAEQRKKLGVELNDKVILLTSDDGEALGEFTVVKGKKEVFGGDENAFSANVHNLFMGKELLVKKAANDDDERKEEPAAPAKKVTKKEPKPVKSAKREEEEDEATHSKGHDEKQHDYKGHDKAHAEDTHDKKAHDDKGHDKAHAEDTHDKKAHGDKGHDKAHAGGGHTEKKPILERIIGDGAPRDSFESRMIEGAVKKGPGAVKWMCGYFSQLVRGTLRGSVSMLFRAPVRFITEPFKHIGRSAKKSWNIMGKSIEETREYRNVGKVSPIIKGIVKSTATAVGNVLALPFMPFVGAATAVAEDTSTIFSAVAGNYGEVAKAKKVAKLEKRKVKLEKKLEKRKKALEAELAKLSGGGAANDEDKEEEGAHQEHV